MYSTILVALDGSKQAEAALKYATFLAAGTEAEVILLRALSIRDELLMEPEDGGSFDFDSLRAGERQAVEEYLRGLAGAMEVPATIAVVEHLDALVDYAEAEKVDLLVLTSHGRTGLDRWWHGSVAEGLARHAPCPVLVVKGRTG